MAHHMMNRLASSIRLRPRHRGSAVRAAVVALAAASLGFAAGCQQKTDTRPDNAPPAAVYSGPQYLRGTVGSMASLRNYQPLLVSGYGLVVGLDGTGSQEVPAYLRQELINRLRQMGVGSTRTRQSLPDHLQAFGRMTPEQVLADPNTAIVAVQGFLPEGGVRGSRFDVLVSALPQTQTQSLAGGTLWTTELGIDGTNPALPFTRSRAEAQGPIYINPFDDDTDDQDKQRFLRQAVVVSGGKVTLPQQIELVLNQPSWNRSRAIADRINERFPAGPGSRVQTAEAETALIIRLNVPEHFATEPDLLMELIAHLYIQRGPDFEAEQAERLARILREDESTSRRVVLAWRALGRMAIPVLRNYYDDEQPHVRLAALEAGAWLLDERAGVAMSGMVEHDDPAVRQRIAEALVHLPRSVTGSRALKALVNDPEPAVRIAAYESLAAIRDPLVERMPIRSPEGLKFVIDRIPADEPMIYITQEHFPRLVIFDDQLGFRSSMFAQMWDSRLMIRTDGEDEPLNVYYQQPGTIEGKTYEVWPNVASLAYLMASRPNFDGAEKGLDLTYSQVIETIYRMAQDGDIDAPVEINVSPLARRVAEYESTADDRRPEVDPETPEPVLGPDPVTDGDWLDRPGQATGNAGDNPWMRRPRIERLGDMNTDPVIEPDTRQPGQTPPDAPVFQPQDN
ncbi:MAG: flagellar basal body P-ring protein FlgI [Phycisphaeraceae bacterium]